MLTGYAAIETAVEAMKPRTIISPALPHRGTRALINQAAEAQFAR